MLTYSFQILTSLMMVAMVLVMLVMAEESAERIAEVLTEQSSIREPEHPVREVADGSIDFSHVYFKYSKSAKRNVLEDINLHIASGETIGIIGGTGTSKSSLIQLISRLYDVSEGSVQVGGHDVREYDLTTLRNQVAVVLQKNVLFSGTILENMRWGNAQASLLEIQEACRLAQADEFIERFPDGYDTHIEQGGSNVSGGQKQRLCIARAFEKAENPHFGRLHKRGRYAHGCAYPQGAAGISARDDQAHHCAADGLGRGRGPHPRDGRRARERDRNACTADPGKRDLSRSL